VNVQKISAVTLLVTSMPASVRFYRDLLGMEVIYGDENSLFFLSPHERWKGPDPQSRTRQPRDPVGAADLPRFRR
jgi:catechol 2,3-dioxygenase-like lactoylglutathione lyase family enzyme